MKGKEEEKEEEEEEEEVEEEEGEEKRTKERPSGFTRVHSSTHRTLVSRPPVPTNPSVSARPTRPDPPVGDHVCSFEHALHFIVQPARPVPPVRVRPPDPTCPAH